LPRALHSFPTRRSSDLVLAVGTAGMLVERGLWRRLGGPDPVLGPFEDGRDVSQRARLAGHRVVVVPRAVVRHARAGYRGWREERSEEHTSELQSRFDLV